MRKKKKSSHYTLLKFPRFFVQHTPYSTRLFISRNGICLERIASFSIQDKFFVCAVNYTRLIFWLKKGLHITKFTLPQKGTDMFNFYNLSNFKQKKSVK